MSALDEQVLLFHIDCITVFNTGGMCPPFLYALQGITATDMAHFQLIYILFITPNQQNISSLDL